MPVKRRQINFMGVDEGWPSFNRIPRWMVVVAVDADSRG